MGKDVNTRFDLEDVGLGAKIRTLQSLLKEVNDKGLLNICDMQGQYYDACNIFHNSDGINIEIRIDWFTALKPQNRWKPTKAMVDALKWAICEFHPDCPETRDALEKLYCEINHL